MTITSAAGILSLLDELNSEIQAFALKKLDTIVDEFWPEISEAIEKIEILYEETKFPQRHLAALVVSKIYYHLGSFDDALTYALCADDLFDVNSRSEYVETILAKCIDLYVEKRVADESAGTMDPRLETVVNRLFQRCLDDEKCQEALGLALEARRLDLFEEAVKRSKDPAAILNYAFNITINLICNRSFRNRVLLCLVELYKTLENPDYVNICQCLIILQDASTVAEILNKIVRENNTYMAYQISFDLYESGSQQFLRKILEQFMKMTENYDDKESASCLQKVCEILSGKTTIELHLQFLMRSDRTGSAILKQSKDVLRGNIAHNATVIANALMYSGTTKDHFLRDNLEWLARATNWAKFTATASLGVINRGNESESLKLMQTYLPKSNASSSYCEGGSLYALGLIHANHGENIIHYLLNQLKEANSEVVKHGGCLGLGLAAMGTCRDDLYELLRFNLYQDDAVVGEIAAMAMGLVMFGSNNASVIEEMIAYAKETQHEKIIRGLAVGLGLLMYGRLEEADTLINRLLADKDPILRRAATYVCAMAYVGTGHNRTIRRLLCVAVTDTNDEVRRAAVISLGFLLSKTPKRCPSLVSLLIESYNPHVRYGAAIALGVACAGTGLKEAIDLLEPIINSDSVSYVRQGAIIASAMILMQHTDNTCPKLSHFRATYAQIVANKHEDVMVKFGAILAQGIVDAGGRSVTVSLQTPSGHTNMTAVAGMLLFTQYWYWFPLAHCLSLAFVPTCLIGLNGDLKMLKLNYTSKSKPGFYTYVPPKTETKKEEKVETVVLSVKQKAHKRKVEVMDLDEPLPEAPPNDVKEEKCKTEVKILSEVLSNPARVVRQQLEVVVMEDNNHYVPMKRVTAGGIILMKNNAKPGSEEIVEAIPHVVTKEGDEPEPEVPEPFEWTD